jgi:hypothetical protein
LKPNSRCKEDYWLGSSTLTQIKRILSFGLRLEKLIRNHRPQTASEISVADLFGTKIQGSMTNTFFATGSENRLPLNWTVNFGFHQFTYITNNLLIYLGTLTAHFPVQPAWNHSPDHNFVLDQRAWSSQLTAPCSHWGSGQVTANFKHKGGLMDIWDVKCSQIYHICVNL